MIHKKLLKRRKLLCIPINGICKNLDVSENNFSHWEKTGCPVEPTTFTKWVRYLQLTLPFLCDEYEGEFNFPIIQEIKYEKASFKENYIGENGRVSSFNTSFRYSKYADLDDLVAANVFVPEFPIFKNNILILKKVNNLDEALNADSKLYTKVDDVDWKLVYIFAADKNNKNIRMFEIIDYDTSTDEYIIIDRENGEPERYDDKTLKPVYVVVDCYLDVSNTLPQTKLIYKKYLKK